MGMGATKKAGKKPITLKVVLGVLTAVTALIAASVALVNAFHGGDGGVESKPSTSVSVGNGSCVVTGDHNANIQCPITAPSSTAGAAPAVGTLSTAAGCGGEPVAQHPLPKAEICVVYWCKGEIIGARSGQMAQIKLRPKVTNNSDTALDVRTSEPSAFLLLVGGAHADKRWLPPPKTAASTLHPRRVSVNGVQYWGLPPNVTGDFSSTSSGYYTGFGSTWDQTSVAPGSSYLAVGTNADGSLVHHGNLVFEVPTDATGEMHPVGLALVNRNTGGVLAFQAFADWGKPSAPELF